MQLPTLYKRNTNGSQQEWAIWTEENVICTRWGQTDGKMQDGRDTVKKGKNIGRSNETTPVVQAELEAKAKWEKKKKDRGYVENAGDAMEGKTDAVIEGGIFPMLAHRFDNHEKKILWPAYVQPKLDGHRCIVVVKDGKATLWSRKRRRIPCLPHIEARFEELIGGDAVFDGELYNHDYCDNFEDLTSFIRQQTEPKPGYEVVQYHIYDGPDESSFATRFSRLREFFLGVGDCEVLKLVETIGVTSKEKMMVAYDRYIDQGYEGGIVRNMAGAFGKAKDTGSYAAKRSFNLQKVKEFIDAEFVVLDVKEGRGKLAGKAIFIMEYEGRRFDGKMKGKLDALKKYFEHPELAVGRAVTVQYFGLTKTNKVPRHPVVLRFREDV